MKCPTCVEEGTTSKLYSRGSMTTAMGGGEPYWDEEGQRHRHEPNITTTAFYCSNGHTSKIASRPTCPAQSCSYNDDPLTKAKIEAI